MDFRLFLAFGLALGWQGATGQNDIGLTIPESVKAVIGDPVTLPATYTTKNQVISVAWFKLDRQDRAKRTLIYSYYPMSGRGDVEGAYAGRVELVGKASLRIKRTKLEDDGTYVLSVMVEGSGVADGFVTLSIMVPPTVKVGPSNPYITAWGRSGVLTCAVKDAKPNITSLHWEKDGEVIDSLRYSTKYSGGTMESPALEIRHISRTDSGVYACVAGHTVRSSSASLRMKVLYPASIISISEPVTATVSDSVTLQCVADGNPPPNITWSRNGILMRSNVGTVPRDVIIGAIQLKNVQTNDTGTYLCKASNGVGDISTRSTALTIKGLRDRVGASTVAVIVGLTAGLLWLVVCVGLVAYLVRRRQRQKEKKKFAFYYNMGRREPDVGDGGVEEDKEPPPYTAMPAKPETKTSRYGGINTVRRSLGKKDRRYARALYGYRPREDNELTLEVDDVIEVLEGEDGGWCLGYLRGRIGLFPSNYVRFISGSEALAMKSGGACQNVVLQESVGSQRSI
ncbi:nectin-4-like [Branchiostoma floridae]|uniref:Nectin-4-like n=1 Tax=Branchiostoma floridae TaxID=7739 RepID=A0A9J7N9P5_BRAFL|nr:nectin-4-like [Branchiostoma floridae]